MADKANKYDSSAFAAESGVAPLKEQAAQLKTDPASLRQQAVEQYQPTFEVEQRSLNNQLTALIKSQAEDSDLLNKQYQQSVNTMLEKIKTRGLATGNLPQVQTDALNKFHNEVMAQRQTAYGVQRQGIQNTMDTLQGNYELNIQARMATNKDNTMSSLSNMLTNIAKLQNSSFQDYIQYLLNKKKAKGGGGGGGYGGRRYGGRYGGSGGYSNTPDELPEGLGADYYGQMPSGMEVPNKIHGERQIARFTSKPTKVNTK